MPGSLPGLGLTAPRHRLALSKASSHQNGGKLTGPASALCGVALHEALELAWSHFLRLEEAIGPNKSLFSSKMPQSSSLKSYNPSKLDDNNGFKMLEVCYYISCILLSSPVELLVELNCSGLCEIAITGDSREAEGNLCCLHVNLCNLFDLSHF